MNPRIQKKLIRALRSEQWLMDFSPSAPLCRIMPNGDHVFSPAGVLCDLAPKEVADWVGQQRLLTGGRCFYTSPYVNPMRLPHSVDAWAALGTTCDPPMNGHGTLEATIKAIEKL